MSFLRTSQRLAALRPTAVNAILAEVRAFREQGEQPVSLMRGEPDLPTPEHIVTAAQESLAAGRTAYPNNQGEPELREAVAERLERTVTGRYGPDDEILITSGATFGIWAALTAVLDSGDEVLLPEPIYDAYHAAISLAGGVAAGVPSQVVDGRFAPDVGAFRAACGPRTRMMLLNTPWNPTGSVLRKSELSDLMAVAEEHDLIVLSDEIYETVIYDGRRHVSPAAVSDEARSRTVIVNSLSKTYAMTGWRIGYCAGPADLIAAMYLVLQQSSRGPATFVQDAGVAALRGPQDCVADMQREYAQRRQQVCEALADIPHARVLVPEAGFFAMINAQGLGMPSEDIRHRLLVDFGVVVVHGSAYGPAGEGMLRVSFATGGGNLSEGLRRLRQGLLDMA